MERWFIDSLTSHWIQSSCTEYSYVLLSCAIKLHSFISLLPWRLPALSPREHTVMPGFRFNSQSSGSFSEPSTPWSNGPLLPDSTQHLHSKVSCLHSFHLKNISIEQTISVLISWHFFSVSFLSPAQLYWNIILEWVSCCPSLVYLLAFQFKLQF